MVTKKRFQLSFEHTMLLPKKSKIQSRLCSPEFMIHNKFWTQHYQFYPFFFSNITEVISSCGKKLEKLFWASNILKYNIYSIVYNSIVYYIY